MKKNYLSIACTLAALFLAVSCNEQFKEEGEAKKSLSKNEIAFTIGDAATKAGGSDEAVQGETIMLGVKTDDGELSFIETIETLDFAPAADFGPATKGTPAYTQNIAALYGSFDAHVYGDDNIPEAVFAYDGTSWSHTYEDNPWATSDPIHYWMNMPAMTTSSTFGVDELGYDGSKISFKYESPLTAGQQTDILFTTKDLTRAALEAGQNHLLFYHALTGVKFAIGNTLNGTMITKVELSGLYGKGSCEVTPNYVDGVNTSAGDPSNVDGNAATKSAECVVWKDKAMLESPFTAAFDKVVSYSTEGRSGKNNFADSYYAAGNTANLNDENASLTFWLIPQTLTDDVKLTITFTVNGEEHTQEIAFGTALKKPTWNAGELRTYTLTSNYVDVDIEDTVGGTGNDTKENVVITNTGNTNAYLRAVIVGNWFDQYGNIINVAWNEKDFGTFTRPTSIASGNGEWVRSENDGFWYYTKPVQPGEHTNTELFTKYQRVATCPGYPTAKLKLSIAVQAVETSKIAAAHSNGWDPSNIQQSGVEAETPAK